MLRQKVRSLSPRAPRVVHSAGEGACCSVVVSDWMMPGGGSVRLDLVAHIGGSTVRVATAFVSSAIVGARLAMLVSGVPADSWTLEAWATNPRGEFGVALDVRGCCAERAVWVEPEFWVAAPEVPAAMRANSAAPQRIRDNGAGTGPGVVQVPRGASLVLASLVGPGTIQIGTGSVPVPVAAGITYAEVFAPLEHVGPLAVTIAGAGAGDYSVVWLLNET